MSQTRIVFFELLVGLGLSFVLPLKVMSQETSVLIQYLDKKKVTPLTDNLELNYYSNQFNLLSIEANTYFCTITLNPPRQFWIRPSGVEEIGPLWRNAEGQAVILKGFQTHLAVDRFAPTDAGRFAIITTIDLNDYDESILPSVEFPRGDGGAYGIFQIFNTDGVPLTPMRNAYRSDLFDFGGLPGRDVVVAGAAFLSNGNFAVLSVNQRGGAGLGADYERLTTRVLALSLFHGDTGRPIGDPIPIGLPLDIPCEAREGLTATQDGMAVRFKQDYDYAAFLENDGDLRHAPTRILPLLVREEDNRQIPAFADLGMPELIQWEAWNSITSDTVGHFYFLHKFHNIDADFRSVRGHHLGILRFELDGDLQGVIRVDDGANHPAQGEISSIEGTSLSAAPDGRLFACWETGIPGQGQFLSHRPLVGRFFAPSGQPDSPTMLLLKNDSNRFLDFQYGNLSRFPRCSFHGTTAGVMALVDDFTREIPRVRLFATQTVPVDNWLFFSHP